MNIAEIITIGCSAATLIVSGFIVYYAQKAKKYSITTQAHVKHAIEINRQMRDQIERERKDDRSH